MEKLLPQIKSPEDLRKLPVKSLPQVAQEIRDFLISNLAEHPGHFASSMGAVEIAIALHYVFNTPYDRIVWDVGHQAYPHKILTGRQDRFSTLRTLNGLSGFPSPEESEYDTFAAGHASNSISAALGMAVATNLNHDTPRRNVVAVIGDASISGGLAFEGLNNAANANADLLIILNDNDMSIDRNVGALNSYLAHITTSPSYNKLRYKVYNGMKRMHMMNPKLRGKILRFNNSLKAFWVNEQNIFEGLNLRYFGPFDGHDVQRIVAVLKDIKDIRGPRLLHLRTVKGKGYLPAESDPTTWHAPGKYDPATGERKKSVAVSPKYQDIFGEQLVKMAGKNEKIVGVTAAMPSGTSMSKMMQAFPDRTFDVGIAEGHAVTCAGGMAKDGLKPFVAIYSSFLQRAYDHIIHDVALNKLPVVLCVDRAGLVGEDGATHNGALDLSYLNTIPNMVVSAPRSGNMLRRLMVTAENYNSGPFSIRYPRGNDQSGENIEDNPESLKIGKGECLLKTEEPDLIILTIGTPAKDAMDAAKELDSTGKKVSVYDMIFLKPMDEEILKEVADSDCPIITLEEGTINGGLGSMVAKWMAEHNYTPKIKTLGIPDKFIEHATPAQQRAMCGIDKEGIICAIKEMLPHKAEMKK